MDIQRLLKEYPIMQDIVQLKPIIWLNPNKKSKSEWSDFPLTLAAIHEAAKLWDRFAPFLAKAFPENVAKDGVLESPLIEIPQMARELQHANSSKIQGRLFLKCDNSLPVVGSIKARGGFYEVLHFAEGLALREGLIKPGGDYTVFASKKFKNFFKQYKIGVGSTGNLGLSIGTISAALGFDVTVYMSADARDWKKDLLRAKGVTVKEYGGDFSEAITEGREKTKADAKGYFVDDENSKQLYLGYAVGALRLKDQLDQQGILVDEDHPLLVYSPCGVGGSPGGTAFGLKQIYGDHVHCFFVEPTHSPAVLVGLVTQKMSGISVQDVGIDNITEADGLAVGRPSQFATALSSVLISGEYTIEDQTLYPLLSHLWDSEKIFLEPSAAAGLIGPQRVAATKYAEINKLDMKNATHVVWATGGDLVPQHERDVFYARGKATKLDY